MIKNYSFEIGWKGGKRNSDPIHRTLPALTNESHQLQTRRSSDLKSSRKSKLPRLPTRNASVSSIKEKSLCNLPPLNLAATSVDVDDVFDARTQKLLEEEPESGESFQQVAADCNKLVSRLEKAIVEWKRSYSKRILQVIVTWLRSQLDQLRFSTVIPANLKSAAMQPNPALFLLKASCLVNANPTIEITPSLDEIQDLLHSGGRIMLCVAKGSPHQHCVNSNS